MQRQDERGISIQLGVTLGLTGTAGWVGWAQEQGGGPVLGPLCSWTSLFPWHFWLTPTPALPVLPFLRGLRTTPLSPSLFPISVREKKGKEGGGRSPTVA